MADFDEAIGAVLENEGSALSDDPNDPGGLSRYGISQRTYPTIDIRGLTEDGAKILYKKDFWRYDGILNQAVATKLFDAAVNMGHAAIKIMQLLVGADDDGIYGPGTEKLINQADPAHLISQFRIALVQHYIAIAEANPDEAKFLKGWLRRARQ